MTLFGPDPVETEVQHILARLQAGAAPGERLRSRHVDLVVEPRRRQRRPVAPPVCHDEATAQTVTASAVCMANTECGGVLVLGVAADGSLIGTGLDGQWLRRRIYDLTAQRLTVTVHETRVRGQRLLLIRSPELIEPLPWNGKIRYRVDDGCAEVDPFTWAGQRDAGAGHDWSALSSDLGIDAVRASAVRRARDLLLAAADERSAELAAARDVDFLRRLNVVTADGRLTNAGVIAFVGREAPAIDYLRRGASSGDSDHRRGRDGLSLVEELHAIDTAITAGHPARRVTREPIRRQVSPLPPHAIQEALINGVVHREWTAPIPTLIEHVDDRLTVTSPGGFPKGVTSHNILTHPHRPTNPALAELFTILHLTKGNGGGVNRMVGDMIRFGYPPPTIEQIPGPFVRTLLTGSTADTAWITFLAHLRPKKAAADLDSLLLLQHLVQIWWVDTDTAAPLLQRSATDALAAITALQQVTASGQPVIEPVAGVPRGGTPAWQITAAALNLLANHAQETGTARTWPTRAQVARSYVNARGRISSTELGSLVGAHPTNLQRLLRELEQQGVLVPGRDNRRGAGFHYVRAPHPGDVPGGDPANQTAHH